MIPYGAFTIAFLGTLLMARRSIGAGVAACVTVGYAYGILRANFLSLPMHLLFDSAVLGLYIGSGPKIVSRISGNEEARVLVAWTCALTFWPLLLFFVPGYEPLVQLVGLRGNAFLLPFLLVGAALTASDVRKMAVVLAILNLAALGIGIAEFLTDVRHFFPMNSVTRIIYLSGDVAGYTAFRIPSSFPNAHAYAGTMVVSLPILIGYVSSGTNNWWRGLLTYSGLVAGLMGVFLAATRTHAAVLFWLVVVVTCSGAMGKRTAIAWLAALAAVAAIVSSDVRLQRFSSLASVDVVSARFGTSVNSGVMETVSGYPLGNGLASGGTSVPYFLDSSPGSGGLAENEYARISIEQGTVGLLLWVGFLMWLLTRFPRSTSTFSFVGKLGAWAVVFAYFATAFFGTGTLTSIPQSALLLMLAGWMAVPQEAEGMARAGQSADQGRPLSRRRLWVADSVRR